MLDFESYLHSLNVAAEALYWRRYNSLGIAEWDLIMDAVERCSHLSSLNKYKHYRDIAKGGLTDLDVNGKELIMAVRRFLPLSAGTLTSLDVQ